ncbi:hypothetical protein HY025_02425 [Candidatus Daviesbacteria bacterium]|nr:hypothetical protein [Candidatus Daviesbacteria bacterium]
MKKKTKRKSTHLSHHKPARKRSFLSEALDKKHRPLHGLALGSVMVLLHSVWAILALFGSVLMILSALAFVFGKSKKSSK